jgi:hypothetical protein
VIEEGLNLRKKRDSVELVVVGIEKLISIFDGKRIQVYQSLERSRLLPGARKLVEE